MTLRKLILASVLLFLYVSLTAQENSNIAASPQVFDFGNITTDHDGKAVFRLTNISKELITISKCKGSCGCFVPKCSRQQVLPGASIEVIGKYDTKRIGEINQSLSVYLNDSSNPSLILQVKGEVYSQLPEKDTDAPIVNFSGDQSPIRTLAVLSTNSVNCAGEIVESKGVGYLVESQLLSFYQVVDRTFFENILEEQKLALSPIFESSDFLQLGQLAGAEGLVITSYSCRNNIEYVNIKLIDCSSSKVVWVASGKKQDETEVVAALVQALSK